jgi:hypothetical protein
VFKDDKPAPVASVVPVDGPGVAPPAPKDGKVAFHDQVMPILKEYCLRCHGGEKVKGKFDLKTRTLAFKGGKNSEGMGIVPGKPQESSLYTRMVDPDEDSHMPPAKDRQPSKEQIELIRRWIAEGANWPDEVALDAK